MKNLIYVLIFILFTNCTGENFRGGGSVHAPSPKPKAEPKFHFQEKIIIIKGFYRNLKCYIYDYDYDKEEDLYYKIGCGEGDDTLYLNVLEDFIQKE